MFLQKLTTFEEAMPDEADEQTGQPSDGEEDFSGYLPWGFKTEIEHIFSHDLRKVIWQWVSYIPSKLSLTQRFWAHGVST